MWASLQSTLSDRFIEFLGLALTVLSGWAINQLRLWLKNKANIELTDAQERRVRELASDAINAAEEWAHRQSRYGNSVTSEDKLGFARGYLTDRMPVLNGEAEGAIHAALGKHRSLSPPSGG
jgi:hypothetical protein